MKTNTVYAAKAALGRNWWKYALAGIGFYLFFVKDLSLKVHIGLPAPTAAVASAPAPVPASAARPERDQRMAVSFFGQPETTQAPVQEEELATLSEDLKHAFLKRFSKVALAEQQKFGIPASLILAAALLQSRAGESDLARQSKNYFSLPCGGGWKGTCREFRGDSFRRYETAWDSFRDFSRHASATFPELRGKNYKVWAAALQESGWADQDNCSARLIGIIDHYGLAVLDE